MRHLLNRTVQAPEMNCPMIRIVNRPIIGQFKCLTRQFKGNSKILEAPGAQPLDPTYHRAIHWTPSAGDSNIVEPPAESPGDSNSKIFELPCEPTEPPHELPGAPYRVRLEYINVPAYKGYLK